MSARTWILALALLACAGANAQGLGEKFDGKRDASADVAQAVATAAAQGKRVIVDVGGEWCAWCHILDRFVTSHADVRALVAANFVWVKVNWSPANRNEALLARWPRVPGYPHLFVLDGQGRLVRSQPTSELEAGKDYDPQKVAAFLEASRGR